jgi:hypothetical protein
MKSFAAAALIGAVLSADPGLPPCGPRDWAPVPKPSNSKREAQKAAKAARKAGKRARRHGGGR